MLTHLQPRITMINTLRIFVPGVVAISALVLDLQPQARGAGWYFNGDAGGSLTANTDLKEFFGPVTPGSKVKFDPGVRVGASAGYFVTDWFAGEVSFGAAASSISSITDAERVDAVFSNVPFLVG